MTKKQELKSTVENLQEQIAWIDQQQCKLGCDFSMFTMEVNQKFEKISTNNSPLVDIGSMARQVDKNIGAANTEIERLKKTQKDVQAWATALNTEIERLWVSVESLRDEMEKQLEKTSRDMNTALEMEIEQLRDDFDYQIEKSIEPWWKRLFKKKAGHNE